MVICENGMISRSQCLMRWLITIIRNINSFEFLSPLFSMSNQRGETYSTSTSDVGQQSQIGGAAGAASQNSQQQRRQQPAKQKTGTQERTPRRDVRQDSTDQSIVHSAGFESPLQLQGSQTGRSGMHKWNSYSSPQVLIHHLYLCIISWYIIKFFKK